MSIVSSCPECANPVSLPVARPESRVRCPVCSAEYELRRAVDRAPPMLQLVLDAPVGVGGFAVAPALSASAMEHGDIARGFTDALDLGGSTSGEAENFEELDTELEGAAPSIDDLMADTADFPTDTEQLDFEESPATDSPFSLSGAHAEHASLEPADSETPAFTATEPGISVAASALKRRKREPSFIGNLIGVVGGGVVGCAMAYFIVLWIGGPEKDFLELGPKLPKWMLPSSFSNPGTALAPTSPATPMAGNPTAEDLQEVKQAANPDDKPMLKINVPELPDKPAKGEDLTDAVKLPFETETSKPEDLAAELNADDGIGGGPIDVPNPVKEAAASETVNEEPKQEVAPFKEPVVYTADDLKTVLDEVNQLADTVANGKPTRKQLMDYYRKLYRLGEVATFAKDAADAKRQVNVLLTKLAADPAKLTEIGRNGAGFFGLDPAKQGEDKGVLLAGVVERSEASGALHHVTLMPVGAKQPINVYSATDPGLRTGSTVLVLGSIVNGPQSALNGFNGDAQKIVWLGASAIAKQ